jgi:hypothetical protein
MVIDLDDVPLVSDTLGRRRWSVRRSTQQPVALVAVLLALFVLGGSARPLPGLRSVLVADGSSGVFELSSSTLFTAKSDASAGDLTSVRRYSLADRSTTWTAQLPQPVEQLDFAASANVLVAASGDNAQISVLDGDTGTVLWRDRSGAVVLRLADTSALLSSTATQTPVLRRVDLRTGKTLWSRSYDSAGYLNAGDPTFGAPTRIVTVNHRGLAAVFDFTDGKVLTTAGLGAVPTSNDDGRSDTAHFAAFDDRLYLARRESGKASVTAYRLGDLHQLWHSTSAPVGNLTWCGSLLCVTTGSGMSALDSTDGSMRWSDTQWLLGYDARAARIPGPPRLVVIDGLQDPRSALLDPASGRVLAKLGRSVFVGGILLRSDEKKVGRTWVQVPEPGDRFRTVDHLDAVAPIRCEAAAGYLACPASTGSTTVWQIPN